MRQRNKAGGKAAKKRPRRTVGRQITVAVVDDDPNILGSVRELLSAEGFITEPFASAERFLASGVIPRVDCLLVDIRLAGASGTDLRDHLEACRSKLPVIFMTGLNDEALHRQALNAGCVALLHKPFPVHQLIDAIEKAVPQGGTSQKGQAVSMLLPNLG
jgi:FixJ family two-component response regulator